MEQTLTTIQHTPLWVWPLLALTIWMGINCGRTRQIRVEMLVIVPAVFFLLAVRSITGLEAPVEVVAIWCGGLAMGAVVGWLFNPHRRLIAAQATRRVEVPGEWVTLTLLMAYFAISYYVGYRKAVTPEDVATVAFLAPVQAINGGFAGYFAGRSARYFRRYLEKEAR